MSTSSMGLVTDSVSDSIFAATAPVVSSARPEPGRLLNDSVEGCDLIFVTNRGPIEHSFTAVGAPEAQRGAGGVVSGLLCAARNQQVSWIALTMTDADREVATRLGNRALLNPAGLHDMSLRLVTVSPEVYAAHYDGFSNRVLWFAQHGLVPERRPALSAIRAYWQQGYVPVNAAIADAVVQQARIQGPRTPIMFHDYHLYKAPALVRAKLPEARLLHFIHVPWPEASAWGELPTDIVREIYEGLAACDVISFQTERDACNFLHGAQRYLPEARIAREAQEITWHGRQALVRAHPIALTPSAVRASASAPGAQQRALELLTKARPRAGHKLLLRVDRIEPTKNIVRGFLAYERILREHEHLRGNVTFLALLVPSRESMPEYQDYAARVRDSIARINAAYGTAEWQPIVAVYGNDHQRALACMGDYDALLVNPLIDGMNLVAKEGGLLNARNGVILLSDGAGAYSQLRDGVLRIEPTDVEQTAAALHEALTMPTERRARLAQEVRRTLLREDASTWLSAQLDDLAIVRGITLPRLPAVPAPGLSRHMAPGSYDGRAQPHVATSSAIAAPTASTPVDAAIPKATN